MKLSEIDATLREIRVSPASTPKGKPKQHQPPPTRTDLTGHLTGH